MKTQVTCACEEGPCEKHWGIGHLRAKVGGLQRHQPCCYLHLRHPAWRTVRKKITNYLNKTVNGIFFFLFLCRPQNTNTLPVLICKYASEEIVTSLGLLVSIIYLLLQIHLLFPFHWNNQFRKRENLLRSYFLYTNTMCRLVLPRVYL